jgi:CHAT domain-containing protein
MSRTFPPLPQTLREGRSVAARFENSVLLTHAQATLRALEHNRPQAELFHFAGHGFSNATNGGLLLAPEQGSEEAGILDAKRLEHQDWSRCRLAVLSACSTGTGEVRGPVNPESLVRNLLWAGVARVIATRWNVDAETGVLLMDQFYDALLSGSDVARSLQQAARRLRENSATSHPYYWAAFQNFGTR